MPIVFTQEKMNAALAPKAGWSLAVLRDFKEDKSKSDANYTNQMYYFECLGGPGNSDENKGRTIAKMISNKAIDKDVRDALRSQIEIAMAFERCNREELTGMEVDQRDWVGKEIYIEIKDEIVDGKPVQSVVSFASNEEAPF